MLAGERSRALSLIEEGESLLRAIGADTFRMRFSRIIADVYDRPIPESIAMLRELRDESAAAGRAVQLGLAEELWGATQVVAGKASQALPALERAVDNLESSGFVDSAMLARVASAMAAAISGDITRACIEIDEVLPRSKGVPYIDGWALQGVAVIQACQGLFEDAAATFELAADAHDARGFSQASVIALTEAARAGNAAGVLPRIDAMAGRVEGACIAVAVRHSRALAALSSMMDHRVSESPEQEQEQESTKRRLATEFDELGHAAAGLGLHAHASEAFSRASELHGVMGDERPASASARLSEEQVAACGGVRSPFVTILPPVQLSSREYEIAFQASLGRSNRQIADDLVLSVRTVETHLLRVYRKLGVGGRTDLVDALPLAGRNAR